MDGAAYNRRQPRKALGQVGQFVQLGKVPDAEFVQLVLPPAAQVRYRYGSEVFPVHYVAGIAQEVTPLWIAPIGYFVEVLMANPGEVALMFIRGGMV